MRECGYHFEGTDEKTGELVFIRRLSVSDYPRFHAYLKHDAVSEELIISFHLDQKKPTYKGAIAHSGEYGGEIVGKEAKRIRNKLGL